MAKKAKGQTAERSFLQSAPILRSAAALPDNQLRVRAAVAVFIHHKLPLIRRKPIAALAATLTDLSPIVALFIVQQLRRLPIGQAAVEVDKIPFELIQLRNRLQSLQPQRPKLFQQLLFYDILLTG